MKINLNIEIQIKLKIKSSNQSTIKYISGIIMMKIELITRNFEKLQRFLQNLRKSEQISLKSAEITTKFENCKLISIDDF